MKMPVKHSHEVYDSDHRFLIDPVTRAIENAESKKTLLMQNDHNSEVFTFELPRYIEGHDMMLCNKIELHYINLESTKRNKNLGVYEIKDLAVAVHDTNLVKCTWLISDQATMYAGSLSFLIKFACVEEGGIVTYRWNTGINNSITISSCIENSDAVIEFFPDILAQWKEEIFATNYAYKLAVERGFEGDEDDWLATLKGERGEAGLFVGPTEPGDFPYFWFDTSSTPIEPATEGMLDLGNYDAIDPLFVDIEGML